MKLIKKLLTNFGNFPFFIVKVDGESGWPVLIPGRFYLVSDLLKPKLGDWVVFKNPKNFENIFIKKVNGFQKGQYILEGLVSWSSSIRDFGPVPKELILGKLLFI